MHYKKVITVDFQKKVQWYQKILLCNLNVLIEVKYDVSANKNNKLVNDVNSVTNLYKFCFVLTLSKSFF